MAEPSKAVEKNDDREELLEALKKLAHPIHWENLKKFVISIDEVNKMPNHWDKAKCADSERNGALAKKHRKIAETIESYAEQYRQSGFVACILYEKCNQLLAKLAPKLLGEMPIVTGEIVKSIDPLAMAQKLKALLGNVLAITEPIATANRVRKSTSKVARNEAWLAEFQSLGDIDISYFAETKKIRRSTMSKALKNAREAREISSSPKNSQRAK